MSDKTAEPDPAGETYDESGGAISETEQAKQANPVPPQPGKPAETPPG